VPVGPEATTKEGGIVMVPKRWVVLVCVALSLSGAAVAAPTSGVGINAEISSTSVTDPALSGTLHATGAGIGFDYQAAVGDKLSINPQVMIVHETGDDILVIDPGVGNFLVGTELDYTVIGVQLLFWPSDQFYLGGGFANHNVKLTLTEKSTRISASTSDSAVGPSLAVGLETPNGLYVGGRYDSVKIQGTDFSSLRLLIGYRFH
jgi:Outer membrane protein beta-barrel domain